VAGWLISDEGRGVRGAGCVGWAGGLPSWAVFSDRAASCTVPCPCHATGQAGGPGTARCLGPGQHGARRPPGRAGPKQRATGCMGKYRAMYLKKRDHRRDCIDRAYLSQLGRAIELAKLVWAGLCKLVDGVYIWSPLNWAVNDERALKQQSTGCNDVRPRSSPAAGVGDE